jgi:16S rRNA (cytidine1402-2'-O)-methyltransferase
MTKSKSTLWLIPNAIHNGYENLPENYYALNIPIEVQKIASSTTYWLVENAKNARAFLKSLSTPLAKPLQEHEMCVIGDKKQDNKQWLINAMKLGVDVGVLSESGCPAIADPGTHIVKIAHSIGMRVMPLVGPCSITLALMLSGFSGQSFTFHGYLSTNSTARIKDIQNTEKNSLQNKQAQICIETPYRNIYLLQSLVQTLKPSTSLCIAADISLDTQFVKIDTIDKWRDPSNKLGNLSMLENIAKLDIDKKPCIFLWQA